MYSSEYHPMLKIRLSRITSTTGEKLRDEHGRNGRFLCLGSSYMYSRSSTPFPHHMPVFTRPVTFSSISLSDRPISVSHWAVYLHSCARD